MAQNDPVDQCSDNMRKSERQAESDHTKQCRDSHQTSFNPDVMTQGTEILGCLVGRTIHSSDSETGPRFCAIVPQGPRPSHRLVSRGLSTTDRPKTTWLVKPA